MTTKAQGDIVDFDCWDCQKAYDAGLVRCKGHLPRKTMPVDVYGDEVEFVAEAAAPFQFVNFDFYNESVVVVSVHNGDKDAEVEVPLADFIEMMAETHNLLFPDGDTDGED